MSGHCRVFVVADVCFMSVKMVHYSVFGLANILDAADVTRQSINQVITLASDM